MDSLKWWKKKEQIQALRRQGFSYREILDRLPFKVAKGTVSRWCKDIELTPEHLDRLDRLKSGSWYRNRLKGSKAIQRRRAEEIANIRAEARAGVPHLTQKELWLAGLMLYWAEGGKKSDVCFSNSDPNAVRLAMRWFREICRVPNEKFKLYLNIHSGQNDAAMKTFWSRITGVSLSQFGKSYVKKEGTGHRKNVLYQGTIRINICDRNLFHTIQGWIEGLAQKISGPLAQLEEQGPLKPKVEGSNPSRPNDLDDVNFVMDRKGRYRLRSNFTGHVAELEDAQDLGSCPERGGGSTPSVPKQDSSGEGAVLRGSGKLPRKRPHGILLDGGALRGKPRNGFPLREERGG